MEVRLRQDFYGNKVPKTSSDNIRITIGFSYRGPGQTLNIETSTGKRGLLGDYDQESPAYHDSKVVYKSSTPRNYSFSRSIPLSFWGDRRIDDCAVEVVIRGEGVYNSAVIWDAYTVNLGYTINVTCEPDVGYVEQWVYEAGSWVQRYPAIYSDGERVRLIARPAFPEYHRFSHWSGDLSGANAIIEFYVHRNINAVAHFVEV